MLKARHGAIAERSGSAVLGEVSQGVAGCGVIWRCLVWLGIVRSCPVRLRKAGRGFIDALRGLALYGTVLSCPVRLSKALFVGVFRGLALYGGAGSGPVGSCPVWLCKARRFLARSCMDVWGTVEWGLVLHAKVSPSVSRFGTVGQSGDNLGNVKRSEVLLSMVKRCDVSFGKALSWQGGAAQSEVHCAKVLLWFGEVLFCVAGFIGALYSKVRSYCGVVWNCDARYVVVKFCPVKHCYVRHAQALSRPGIVRCGTVRSGFARLRAAGQALVSLRSGMVLHSWALRCDVWPGVSRFGLVRKGGALLVTVLFGIVM
jgi:hypothetical protein